MAKTKWTQGPWTVHEDERAGTEHAIRQEGTGAFIARTMPDLDIPDPAERMANASLLAAATQLYEALAEARPVLEALQAAHPLRDHDSAVGHGKALRMVRAAIAKAEGR
jgi:hypothetical protein